MVPKNAQVSDLLEALQRKANISDETMQKVRAYETHMHKFHKALPPDYQILSLYDYTQVYVAPFPEDESPKKIMVFHFDKEPSKAHGIPFQFSLKEVGFHRPLCGLQHKLTRRRASHSAKPNSDFRILRRSRASSLIRSSLLSLAGHNIPDLNTSMMVRKRQLSSCLRLLICKQRMYYGIY